MRYQENKDVGYFIDRMSAAKSLQAQERILEEWHRWAIDNGDDFETLYWSYRNAAYDAKCWRDAAKQWQEAYKAVSGSRDAMAETIKIQGETIKAQTDLIAALKTLYEDRFGEAPWEKKHVAGFAGDLDGNTEGKDDGKEREPGPGEEGQE